MSRRDEVVARIVTERARQFNLPGREWDVRNDPNDWIAIAASYCLRSATRKGEPVSREDFEDDLVKAAAVILAALEHTDLMQSTGRFRS
jgi:hypothetical protein